MTDTANPLAAIMDQLREHGWTCEHPHKWWSPVKDGKPQRAKYLTGPLWHFAVAEIFLTDQCEVMLCGDLHRAHPTDISAAEFLRWLTLPRPVWEAEEKPKVLAGQKSLFGDED